MKQPLRCQFFVCVFFAILEAVPANAAEKTSLIPIKIDAPATPLQPREYAMLAVQGIKDEDYPKAVVTWEPREGVVLLPVKTWGGQAVLIFSASRPAKYTITISVNGRVGALLKAVEDVKLDRIDAESQKEIEATTAKLEAKYPYSLGSAVVEVGGSPPPPVSDVTERVRDAAKAVSEPGRAETAKRLAGVYRNVSSAITSGALVDQAKAAAALKQATDQVLNQAELQTAWKPVRDLVGELWTKLVQEGATDHDYVGLLDAAANGLDAS